MRAASLPKGDRAYIWRWPPKDDVYRWYKKSMEIAGTTFDVNCPLPTPYDFYEYAEKAPIAVGFEIGKVVPTCETSDDCKEDEFCGGSTNPTYATHETSENPFYCRNSIDRSHRERPRHSMQFCFKNIDYGGRLIYVKGNKPTGPAYCNNDQECHQMTQDPSYCHKEKQIRIAEKETGKYNTVGGQCLRARICSKNNHTNEYGSLGDGGKFCDINNPSTCPLLESMKNSTVPITPVCVSAYESGNYKVSLCCYMVPETTTTTMDSITETIKSLSVYQTMFVIILVTLFRIKNV